MKTTLKVILIIAWIILLSLIWANMNKLGWQITLTVIWVLCSWHAIYLQWAKDMPEDFTDDSP